MKLAMHVQTAILVILLGLTSALVQAAPLTKPVQKKERPMLFPSTRMINQGRAVAETSCASCHGMDGIGDQSDVPRIAGQRAVYLYRVQQGYRDGTRSDEIDGHNGFLNEEAMLAVSAYYSSLAVLPKPEAPEMTGQDVLPDEDSFLVIRDAMSRCVKCHGETGNASGSGMPNLTAQHPDYFVISMMGYIDGSRSHRLMKRLVGNLDEASIRDMGVFYALQEPTRSKTQGEGDVNVGRRLALECASCHGENGNTNKVSMPSLAGQDAKYFIKAMKHYQDGKRKHDKMFDAVKHLSEQDVIDLATYYAAQEPIRRNVRAPLKSTEWIARCARCHGMDGNSSDPRFPMLAGQDAGYLKKVLKTYAAGERNTSVMHAMADPLSAMDIERIATYFASQQPKAVVYIALPCEDDQ